MADETNGNGTDKHDTKVGRIDAFLEKQHIPHEKTLAGVTDGNFFLGTKVQYDVIFTWDYPTLERKLKAGCQIFIIENEDARTLIRKAAILKESPFAFWILLEAEFYDLVLWEHLYRRNPEKWAPEKVGRVKLFPSLALYIPPAGLPRSFPLFGLPLAGRKPAKRVFTRPIRRRQHERIYQKKPMMGVH